jgi:hypothetical protein
MLSERLKLSRIQLMQTWFRSAALSAALAVFLTVPLDAQNGGITRRESRGEVRNRVTAATVVAAIENTARVTERIDNLGELPRDHIRVLDVRPYLAPARASAYRAALDRNATRIGRMRAELTYHDEVVRALAERKFSVDDVIAASVLEVVETAENDNVLVLYVDPRGVVARTPTVPGFTPTNGALFAAIHTTPEMVARVSVLEVLRSDRVRLYDVDAILGRGDADAFRAAIRSNETSLRSLRAELGRRNAVMEALARHDPKLMLGEIFAADIVGSGDVLILYFKRKA